LKLRPAGVGSVLPTTSVARTSKLCLPWESFEWVFGELQAAQAPESRRHSKLEPASLELNLNFGERFLVRPEGPEVIVVSGASTSGGTAPEPSTLTPATDSTVFASAVRIGSSASRP
jgi:hypothetical protein